MRSAASYKAMTVPMLVDTHCHLQADAFDGDREDAVARALESLAWIAVIGDDLASSEQAVDMVRPRVYATVGVHPHNASQWNTESLDRLRALSGRPGVIALGEIGLDYHYDFSPRDAQRDAFSAQLAYACECRLPVVIHCREAEDDLLGCLEPYHRDLAGGVMHCFGGDAAFARTCLDFGFHVSFAGNVTFPKAEPLREAARVVPMDRLMVETDSPYLAPKPLRGRRCEPGYVEHTARLLAELKGVDFETFCAQTTRNAEHLFGIVGRR